MEQILTEVARQIQTRYYGKYRGFVVDNADPEKRARLKLRIPSVAGAATTGWALPCLPFGGSPDAGWFAVPEPNAQVWVEFEEGDPSRPIWTGTFWQTSSDVPAEAAKDEPTTRLWKTPGKGLIQFDDAAGEERLCIRHVSEAQIEIDSAGSLLCRDKAENRLVLDAEATEILIEDANGNSIRLSSAGIAAEDAHGNVIETAAAGVTVKAQKIVLEGTQVALGGDGGEPVIKGQSFLTLFATHMHTCSAPGSPTSPPVPQGEMSTLSAKVTAA